MLTNILRLILARTLRPFEFKNCITDDFDLDVKNLGLYVHIPFCRDICPFCPYYKIEYDSGLAREFKRALLKEIDLVSQRLVKKKEIKSMYWGGGTPALMGEQAAVVTEKLKEYFVIKGNSAIELHPRDIDEGSVRVLEECGFDMVSLGIQSFQPDCLKSLGREYINGLERLKLVQKANFKTIDVDLIFGIPGQSEDQLKSDFIIAADNGATQISTYPFIDFSYLYNRNKPVGYAMKKRLLWVLLEISRKVNFERTSVWTFARKGTPKYSSVTRDNFIGFGPSASTLLRDRFKINTFSVTEYIKSVDRDEIPTALTLLFNERIRVLYWLFWSSYNLDIDENKFRQIFGRDLLKMFSWELKIAELMNIIKRYENGYKLTTKGSLYFHLVEQEYTNQYIDKTWRIAHSNPWPKKLLLY